MTLAIIAFATFLATLLGGFFALKLKDKLHLILGFSAGAVVAVAFFDLLPESLDLGAKYLGAGGIISISALGFMAYLVLDRLIFLHGHVEVSEPADASESAHASDPGASESAHYDHLDGSRRGILGAGSLSLHSFLDGLAIGLAFEVGSAAGAIVAAAVLTHDFSDGINTVNMITKNGGGYRQALKWLLVDALAPVIGIAVTLFLNVSERGLGVILALFSGFFLYIGASDLVPESHHVHPKFLTTLMTIFGALVLYAAVKLAAI
jgi:ZIP family zinc transporter